jgi:hypothetical protein
MDRMHGKVAFHGKRPLQWLLLSVASREARAGKDRAEREVFGSTCWPGDAIR